MSEEATYPSDLTQKQCDLLASIVEKYRPEKRGSPGKWPLISIVNAIMYVLKSGCQWRMVPFSFPPWQTVYYHYSKWSNDGLWGLIHDTLNKMDRAQCGRELTPSASIIDSQSVKTTESGGPKGYDAGKKINGRKRHIIVDTEGRIIGVTVHEANVQDRDGAKLVLPHLKAKYPRLKLIWADGGYAGQLVTWVKEKLDYDLEIVKRSDDAKGFKILPRRWVVERTFGWFNRFRRLSRDFEYLLLISENVLYIAMIYILIKRLAE